MIDFNLDFTPKLDKEDQKYIDDAFNSLYAESENGISGYYHLPKTSKNLIKEIKNYQNQNHLLNSIDTIALIGIGGSSLGTKAIDSIFKIRRENIKNIIFLENPDPVSISNSFKKIKRDKTLFIVVSKSGKTIETISIFKATLAHFNFDLSTKDKDRFIIITDNDSPLHKFANEFNIQSFTIPKNVGGRFSVLSSVGIVPLLLAGYNVDKLLNGAQRFIESFFARKEEHLMLKGCHIAKYSHSFRINVLFSYSDSLENFNKWFVQLWAESLGKINTDGKNVGLTPIGHIGTVDQHSFLQLLMDGPKDKSVTFIKIKDFQNDLKIPNLSLKYLENTDFVDNYRFNDLINSECDATKESLISRNLPIDTIVLDKIDEENIGELILYFEILTSFVGKLLKVNTYNQPGVELGKKILVEKFNKEIANGKD